MSNDHQLIKKVTQETVDEMVSDFKKQILSMCDGKSLAMAIALGNKDIKECLYGYQEILLPEINIAGLSAPTLSEMFDIEITLTVKGENDEN